MNVIIDKKMCAYIVLNEMIDTTYNTLNEEFNPYKKTVSDRDKRIKEWLENFGVILNSTQNNKSYLCYKIPGVEELIGSSYCICRELDGETHKPNGPVLVKPVEAFRFN